jgi:hypothetical protein
VGQTEKSSVRAYVFRSALELGPCWMPSACLKGAPEAEVILLADESVSHADDLG